MALASLSRGIRETGLRVQRRIACFHGVTSSCADTDITLPQLPPAKPTASTRSALSAADDVRSLLIQSGFPISIEKPLIRLDISSCIAHPAENILFALEDGSGRAPVPVSDIRLVPTSQFAALPYYDTYAQKGLQYVFQNPVTFYNCPDNDRDIGAIATIDDVRTFAASEHLSGSATGTPATALRALETTLEKGPVTDLYDAEQYLLKAEILKTPPDVHERIISLWLETAYGSRGTAGVISSLKYVKPDTVKYDAFALFFTRSSFPALFMEANRSVMPTIPELFPVNTLTSASEPWIYFSSLPDNAAVRAELIRDTSFFHQNIFLSE
jgi:hypothetical protein